MYNFIKTIIDELMCSAKYLNYACNKYRNKLPISFFMSVLLQFVYKT